MCACFSSCVRFSLLFCILQSPLSSMRYGMVKVYYAKLSEQKILQKWFCSKMVEQLTKDSWEKTEGTMIHVWRYMQQKTQQVKHYLQQRNSVTDLPKFIQSLVFFRIQFFRYVCHPQECCPIVCPSLLHTINCLMCV